MCVCGWVSACVCMYACMNMSVCMYVSSVRTYVCVQQKDTRVAHGVSRLTVCNWVIGTHTHTHTHPILVQSNKCWCRKIGLLLAR